MIRRILVILICLGAVAIPRVGTGPLHTAKAFASSGSARYAHVCGIPAPRFARCNADLISLAGTTPASYSSPPPGAPGPVQLHTVYQLPCTPGGPVSSVCAAPASFGPTIAIVDALADPTVESDLGVYDQQYNLPACTQANGCLSIKDENGGSNLPTTVDQSWALEQSLDVQAAHAICQTCKILLIEAASSSFSDLASGVSTAASLGASAISNSYGGGEWSGETGYDSAYNHPGVAVVASTGDSGYGTQYPAASPYVVAVGGTTLTINSDNTYGSETVWNGTGSGCSVYESANSWQPAVPDWTQTACATGRGAADVAAESTPGLAIFDSTPYNGSTGWFDVGGTSLSSPIIASVYVLAGGVAAGVNAAAAPYAHTAALHDVTTGSNGTCTTIMCAGNAGYDGPTGVGSPSGVSAFVSSGITPAPTATATAAPPTATPTPTSTPKPTATSTPTATKTPAPTATPTCSVKGGSKRCH